MRSQIYQPSFAKVEGYLREIGLTLKEIIKARSAAVLSYVSMNRSQQVGLLIEGDPRGPATGTKHLIHPCICPKYFANMGIAHDAQ